MRAIGYRGVLDLGYKLRRAQWPVPPTRRHPRVGSTFRLFVDSVGMDVVRALYLDLTGQPVRRRARWSRGGNGSSRTSTSSRRSPICATDALAIAEWLRSFKGVAEGSWLATDDLASVRGMLAVCSEQGVAQFRGER
jgi:hypothetical protein